MTRTWTWVDHEGIERHYDYCQRRDTGAVFATREIQGLGITGAYGPLTWVQVETVDLLDFPYDADPDLTAWLCTHPDQWRLSLRRWRSEA